MTGSLSKARNSFTIKTIQFLRFIHGRFIFIIIFSLSYILCRNCCLFRKSKTFFFNFPPCKRLVFNSHLISLQASVRNTAYKNDTFVITIQLWETWRWQAFLNRDVKLSLLFVDSSWYLQEHVNMYCAMLTLFYFEMLSTKVSWSCKTSICII